MPCSFWKCQCGRPYLPQRYVMVIFICLAIIIMIVHNVSFSMVIAHLSLKINNTTNPCEEVTETDEDLGLGEWDLFAIAILIASFFLGFLIMLLPGGYMADKLGGRPVCITAVFSSSFFTILSPLLVKHTFFWLVCAGRGFIGGATACVIVSSATLISRWIPRSEWCTVGGTVFASVPLGIVYGTILGMVAEDSLGWEPIFYIWGGIGFVWSIGASLFLYSDPEVHPSMTNRERVYLEGEAKPISQIELDWVAIFLDPAVWGLAAAQVGHAYIAFALSHHITIYYVRVLNVDLWKKIVVIMLPYGVVWILAILTGILADHFIHYKAWRPSVIWKVYFTIASVIPAVFILVIPMMECHYTTVIILAAFGLVLTAPFYCSISINALNLTFNYPGFATGAACICGGFVHFVFPLIVEWTVVDNTFPQWRTVSYVIFANVILNNILYVILGSSKRRLWDMTPEERAYYREQKRLEDEAKKAANTPEAREAAAKKAEEERKARADKKKAEADKKRADKQAADEAKQKAKDERKRDRDNLRRAEHDMTAQEKADKKK